MTCPWCKKEIHEVLTSAPPRCPECRTALGPLRLGTFPFEPLPPPGSRAALDDMNERFPAFIHPGNALLRRLRGLKK